MGKPQTGALATSGLGLNLSSQLPSRVHFFKAGCITAWKFIAKKRGLLPVVGRISLIRLKAAYEIEDELAVAIIEFEEIETVRESHRTRAAMERDRASMTV